MSSQGLKVAAVSGSRADWSLLLPVLSAIREHPKLQLLLWVTGSHLEKRFGNTVQAIRETGFDIHAEVPLNLQTGSDLDTSQALAHAITGFAKTIEQQQPDLLLVLGDRYEIFGAVQAAALAKVPIAHIAGGDISEGAYDDAMRHAISKLSHLHFATNSPARERLVQMGEQPNQVILSGSPGIDAILATDLLTPEQLGGQIDFEFQATNLAVSFHPATLDTASPADQVAELLEALERIDPAIGLVFTGSNADTGGDVVNNAMRDFAADRPNSCFVQSLGSLRYYSLVSAVDLLVGNSSSGLYEAPSLNTPTLDIGIRQQGRLRGDSVKHVDNKAADIAAAISLLLDQPCHHFENPYGDGSAAQRIVNAIAAIEDPKSLLQKRFYQVRAT